MRNSKRKVSDMFGGAIAAKEGETISSAQRGNRKLKVQFKPVATHPCGRNSGAGATG